jgi:HEAT repeat protein
MLDTERQHLTEQLVHADEELRRLAVERTSLLPPAEALGLLVERLADASWRVRKAVVARIASLPERAGAVAALLDAIADGHDPGRRNAALEALAACGRGATLQLVDALASPDVDVRKQVVDVLGAIGDPRAANDLAGVLADPDANVRAAAADALGAVGGRSAAARLQRLSAGDPEPLVRLAALRALVRLEAPIPFETIEEAIADPLLAAAGYAALGQSDAPHALEIALKGLSARRSSAREAAAHASISLVARADGDAGERLAASVREFAAAHPEVAQEVIARIQESAGERRLVAVQFAALLRSPAAARALAQCGTDAAVASAARSALIALGAELPPALARVWSRLSVSDRSFACTALESCGAGAAAERMLRTTLLDPACEVRAAAARALATCSSATSFGELLGRLAQEDPEATRDAAEDETEALIAAVLGLAERGGSEAVDAAIALIETRLLRGSERARVAGARLLARLARAADAACMRSLLCDPSESVRRHAVDGVARLGHVADELVRVALADEAPSVRCAAAQAVAQLGSRDADADLEALAQDRDTRVRAAAMRALGQRAVLAEARGPALARLGEGVRTGGVVALAALAALERVGGAEAAALAALGLRSEEPEIVERAAACVGAHGGEALRGELIALLAHPAWPVRARVARELATARAALAVPHLHARLGEERDEFVREALLAALATLES